jgi:hypothetical protein
MANGFSECSASVAGHFEKPIGFRLFEYGADPIHARELGPTGLEVLDYSRPFSAKLSEQFPAMIR